MPKRLLSKLIYSLVLVVPLALSLNGCMLDLLCKNTIHSEVISPNKQYKAVLFERDCGATTSGSKQVSILGSNEKLPSEPGNIFTMKYYPQVYVYWQSDRLVLIKYPKEYRASRKNSTFKDVTIQYEEY